MEDQTNNRIREEWENKLRNKWETFSVVNDYYENADIRLNSNKIADFFIPEINELLKSQREELVEKIESYKKIELLKLRSCENDKINWNYHQGKVHQLEDLLSNLSTNKENENNENSNSI